MCDKFALTIFEAQAMRPIVAYNAYKLARKLLISGASKLIVEGQANEE